MHWRLGELIVLSICAAGIADAQIYEWHDAGGGRHFTNLLVNIPDDQQAAARVVANITPPAPNGEAAAAGEPAEAPRREAEVVYDFSQRRDRYAQGVRDGLALAASVPEWPDGRVHITGPLAVANATVFQPPPLHSFPEPLVTTSFDRGRSRHLTLRMLLQDQFQLDRDGPFLFERMAPVRRRPNLAKLLPRGVPRYRSGRVSLPAARVVTR